MSDKCECPVRKALEFTLDLMGSGFPAAPVIDVCRANLAAPCPCDQLRAELAAANAEAERLKAAHAIVPDEVEHTFKELRSEYAELRENIDGWTKQCRALEPLVANRRDGESIIDAAAKEIEQLRAENVALRRQVAEHQEWLAHDSQCAENQRLEAANADLRKQARESAYKAAQMRGIVDAAEKLLCGLYEHILPLSEHTREVMRDLRNALGDERDSQQERIV